MRFINVLLTYLLTLCFNLYVAPLSCVIGSFGVRHHQYADDTQMYIAASKSDLKANIDTLEKCTAAVHRVSKKHPLILLAIS